MMTGDEWGRVPLGDVRLLSGGQVVHRRAVLPRRHRRLRRRGTLLNLRTTTEQKCEAFPRRARI